MANVTSDQSAEVFLTARQTRARYGHASDMWLHRRLHDKSGFPQPVVICGRRFWRLSDLIEWENKTAHQPAPRRRPGREKLSDVVRPIVEELDPSR
jgi:predicted DNA-binding transcriptional regulator AlpA